MAHFVGCLIPLAFVHQACNFLTETVHLETCAKDQGRFGVFFLGVSWRGRIPIYGWFIYVYFMEHVKKTTWNWGLSIFVWEITNSWMVYFMENPKIKWDGFWGTYSLWMGQNQRPGGQKHLKCIHHPNSLGYLINWPIAWWFFLGTNGDFYGTLFCGILWCCCDISVIFPSLAGFHSHGEEIPQFMDGKIAIFHGKSTPKNKDGFWVAKKTRKVLNNGRTYSCGIWVCWLSRKLWRPEEEFKQTLRYNPKNMCACMLCCPQSKNWRLLEDSQIPKYHLDDFVHRFMDFQSMDHPEHNEPVT